MAASGSPVDNMYTLHSSGSTIGFVVFRVWWEKSGKSVYCWALKFQKMYGGIQNPSECLFLINLTTPFHYLGCRRISIAQCNEYHLELFWQYYVSPWASYILSPPPPRRFVQEWISYCMCVQQSNLVRCPNRQTKVGWGTNCPASLCAAKRIGLP